MPTALRFADISYPDRHWYQHMPCGSQEGGETWDGEEVQTAVSL